MDERILAEMLEEAGCKNPGTCAKHLVDNDVIVQEHARWIVEEDGNFRNVKCAACGKEYACHYGMLQLQTFGYCPNCGARMDGECNG